MGKNESLFPTSVFYISRALTACLLTVPVCDSTELIQHVNACAQVIQQSLIL